MWAAVHLLHCRIFCTFSLPQFIDFLGNLHLSYFQVVALYLTYCSVFSACVQVLLECRTKSRIVVHMVFSDLKVMLKYFAKGLSCQPVYEGAHCPAFISKINVVGLIFDFLMMENCLSLQLKLVFHWLLTKLTAVHTSMIRFFSVTWLVSGLQLGCDFLIDAHEFIVESGYKFSMSYICCNSFFLACCLFCLFFTFLNSILLNKSVTFVIVKYSYQFLLFLCLD